MENCIFCKIIAKEIPSNIIYEDELFLAFLDIDQSDKGHTLVIPRKHYRWIWDLPAGRQESPNFAEYFENIREVKKLLDSKYHPRFVEMKVWGIDIPHAHVHLIPHYK